MHFGTQVPMFLRNLLLPSSTLKAYQGTHLPSCIPSHPKVTILTTVNSVYSSVH